jgi:hypothetical protein
VRPKEDEGRVDGKKFAIDMGLYVTGGVLLIVAMEQLIQIGGRL